MNMLKELKVDESVIIYRELTTVKDLLSYFSLRYEEYPSAGYHVDSNRDNLDIDPFDFYAHFMGAFIMEGGEEKLVGGVRMIDKDAMGPMADRIKTICALSKDLQKMPAKLRPTIFQLMDTLDLNWLIRECELAGKRLVEFNRTIINPAYRRSGIGIKLVNEIHILAAMIGIEIGFGSCPLHLKSFYQFNGCEPLIDFYYPIHKQTATLLKIDFNKYLLKSQVTEDKRYSFVM